MDVPTADSGETALLPRVVSPEGRVVGGKFSLLSEIGRGATGVVYEARNEWTHRHVALKLMHPGPSAVMRERFVQEARTSARVVHPNIVGVHDLGQDDDGSLFIVQDLLDGRSLEEHLGARATLSLSSALEIFTPIADALAVSHEQHVVHRDVKPSNIVLARARGGKLVPTLVDFGLAKDASEAGSVSHATDAGRLLGTPHYMAPEQITDAAAVDARVDVWALALCLFEALTGSLPFRSTKLRDLFAEIVAFDLEDAPCTDLLPPGVMPVLERALRADRSQRLSSMRELHRDLLALAARETRVDTDEGDPTETMRLGRPPLEELPALRLGAVITTGGIERHSFISAFRTALDRRVEVLRFATYAALVDAIREGEVELAWLPPVAYVRAHTVANVTLLVTCERRGGASYRSALLARRGVVASSDETRGKRAAWVDTWSAAGYLIPRDMLTAFGVSPDRDLAAQGFLESYDAVLDALRAGTADFGATFCHLDADGSPVGPWTESDDVVVLAVSEPIPGDTLCATRLIPTEEIDDLRTRLVANGALLAPQLAADDLVTGDPSRYRGLHRTLFGGD